MGPHGVDLLALLYPPISGCRLAGVAMDVYENESPLFFKDFTRYASRCAEGGPSCGVTAHLPWYALHACVWVVD